MITHLSMICVKWSGNVASLILMARCKQNRTKPYRLARSGYFLFLRSVRYPTSLACDNIKCDVHRIFNFTTALLRKRFHFPCNRHSVLQIVTTYSWCPQCKQRPGKQEHFNHQWPHNALQNSFIKVHNQRMEVRGTNIKSDSRHREMIPERVCPLHYWRPRRT